MLADRRHRLGIGWSLAVALALLTTMVWPPVASAELPSYDLEFLEYPGADSTVIAGVTSDGLVVGTWIIWEPGPLPGPLILLKVRERGLFSYDGAGFMPLEIPGVPDATVQGVNDAGVIWGYTEPDFRAFVFDGDTVRFVAHPDYDNSFLVGIDGVGRIYGTRSNTPEDVDPNAVIVPAEDAGSFIFDGDTFWDASVPGATDPIVGGVRMDGLVWGSDGAIGAFLFDGIDVTIVDRPGEELFNLIHGVTDSGLVVGSAWTGTSEEFVFDGASYHPFGVPGADRIGVRGVNGAGVIWGSATTQQGFGVFVATPEPLAQCTLDRELLLAEVSRLRSDLGRCLDASGPGDADGDGETDGSDACPDTPSGERVDAAGCSLAEFCDRVDVARRSSWRCARVDWRNDEPGALFPRDCFFSRQHHECRAGRPRGKQRGR